MNEWTLYRKPVEISETMVFFFMGYWIPETILWRASARVMPPFACGRLSDRSVFLLYKNIHFFIGLLFPLLADKGGRSAHKFLQIANP
jgi:hypothetical protein